MNDFFRTFVGTGNLPWLRNDESERLFTLRLKGVDAPLDPDPYWESKYGGGTLYEKSSKSSSRRLKEALDAHRTLRSSKGDFDFPIEEMLVFSDVVLWLPSKIWKSSAKEGGQKLFLLSEKLKYRHNLDFGEILFNKRKPNYSIMPLDSLEQDEVIFQFGLGVFLPNKSDIQTAEVKILQDGKEPRSFPHWIFFENQQELERPSSLYSKQHFLLVGNTFEESAIQSPSWFSQDRGYLMIDTHREPNRIYGDDEYIIEGNISTYGDTTICPYYAKKGEEGEEELALMIELINTDTITTEEKYNSSNIILNTHPESIVNDKSVNPSDDPLKGLTIMTNNEPPRFRCYISITGIILPRRSYANVKYWVLHLNESGMPAKKDETSKWLLRGNQNILEWCDTKTKQWLELNIEEALPFPKEKPLLCRPAVLRDSQYAILMLPQQLSFPLSKQVVTLGRGDKNSISLQLLNREDSIEWLRPTRHKHTMGNLGLSKQHLTLNIEKQSMLVQQQSTSAPTYILQGGIVLQKLELGASTRSTLKSDQEIIVGNYLLQYQREYIFDKKV